MVIAAHRHQGLSCKSSPLATMVITTLHSKSSELAARSDKLTFGSSELFDSTEEKGEETALTSTKKGGLHDGGWGEGERQRWAMKEDFRKTYKEENPSVKSMQEVGKACGEKWNTMTFEERVKYYDIATEKRAEYEKAVAEFDKKKESGELSEESDYD
ncbi:hypothetical protein OsJ_02931 [Oryza sativa Japonica Group]|uniref:HMG box domain-containing protein n=3 Tax=Oryza sativa TaxID=4530 RepID=B9EYH7_ORYSJ|nr:hypothetical protein OsJ_02931 [Oryza sativa Japonica Group]